MTEIQLAEDELARIESLVQYYESDLEVIRATVDQLRSALDYPTLRGLYHSIRWRVKDPNHLREKLLKKARAARAEGGELVITPENLHERVNDLAGVRLLHLHTSQFEGINAALLDVLEEHRYEVLEGPEARVWDDELRGYFEGIGVKTIPSKRMYTSVHYVVEANRRSKRTAEIQVRTLAEELWGEVDHTINYPVPSPRLSCREQIKVLARLTSTCTRLVDSIFTSHEENPDQ